MKKYLDLDKIPIDECQIVYCGHAGVGGQKGWIVGAFGIAPCIPASCYKDPLKVVIANEFMAISKRH